MTSRTLSTGAAAAAAALTAAAAAQIPPPEPPRPTQQIEITGGRESDTEQRRQSTAAKIVIGREEIERFGDSTLGEVLRRLPGITTPGAPGRGGGPRMRGLGAGYTQILIDGQRAPPGFAIDSLPPDQVERIEILRAPTAETGARAIGGTINIVTREGYKRRLNDLRVGFGYENGAVSPGLFWTRNDSVGDFIYNLSGSAFRSRRISADTVERSDEDPATGALRRDEVETSRGEDRRLGANLTGRLQWRFDSGVLLLMPVVFHSQSESRRDAAIAQRAGALPPPYDHAATTGDGRFTVARVNANWRGALGVGTRLDANAGIAGVQGASTSTRREFDAAGALLRTTFDDGTTRERTLSANAKLSRLLDGDHSLVGGAEVETVRRNETRVTLQDGAPLLGEFGDDVRASNLRLAAYVQDEWSITPNWAAHAGVRWEGIRTRGDPGDAAATAARQPTNTSRVLTPLLHAVWKPDPKARDQIRVSLTRSYKSPPLTSLVARPRLSSRFPAGGANEFTSPDVAGNPALRPELATGIDVAFERYLGAGGVLSANVFHRRLTDYIRNVVTLETVSWSPLPRYVSRPQNVGGATTQGIELEAKFRLDQAVAGARPVELRANLSLFRSKVDAVPGPDNRLDQQPGGTLNLGADYRIRGTPLTIGGSLNLTPAYRTRISEDQVVEFGRKRQLDAYALWVFDPAVQLRVLASNLAPQDYVSSNTVVADALRTRSRTIAETSVNWQMRLELKL